MSGEDWGRVLKTEAKGTRKSDKLSVPSFLFECFERAHDDIATLHSARSEYMFYLFENDMENSWRNGRALAGVFVGGLMTVKLRLGLYLIPRFKIPQFYG